MLNRIIDSCPAFTALGGFPVTTGEEASLYAAHCPVRGVLISRGCVRSGVVSLLGRSTGCSMFIVFLTKSVISKFEVCCYLLAS